MSGGDTFLRLLVQLPSKCTGGTITLRANGEDHLLPFDNDQAMFCCGMALFYAGMEVDFEELSSGERTLLVFDLDWLFVDGSPPPTLGFPTRASELAAIFEMWESTNPVLILPTRTDVDSLSWDFRPGHSGFNQQDSLRIRRLVECNQYLLEDAKIRVFLGEIERVSEIPEEAAYVGEKTISRNIILQWYAMDGGPCFDPLCFPLEEKTGPFSSQFKFSKKEKKHGRLRIERGIAIFVIKTVFLPDVVYSRTDTLSSLTRLVLELGPDAPKVRTKVIWFFNNRKLQFECVTRLLQGSASAILFAWNLLSSKAQETEFPSIMFYPLWLRFAKDYPSKDDLELQEKWLQSAENSKQWEYPILFSLIAELARPSLPLSMKLRLSKIFAMQPLTSSSYKLREAIITLLYQLFKDHPWSFLEEELECNKVRLWKTVIYLLCERIPEAYSKDPDPFLKASHKSMREEGVPHIFTRWIRDAEESREYRHNLTIDEIQEFIQECYSCELHETIDELANKHIPSLPERDKHKLLVWARSNLPDGATLRMIVKLAVEERFVKLKHIVATEGGNFDGSYPFAVCKDPKIQEFLRGVEAALCLEGPKNDYQYATIRFEFEWRILCTCQFHSEEYQWCRSDPGFSVNVDMVEGRTILTKTSDYFLLQQRLMEERKEELAALLLLSGPTKRVLPPSINPAKRKCP